MSIAKACKIENCHGDGKLSHNGKRYYLKGYCNMHYIRLRRRNSTGGLLPEQFHHGMSNNPLYSTWEGMNQRCNNTKHHAYKNYGGRGIKVCDRWMNFARFVEDMGERPDGLTLDRIDNNGDYEPTNCRWATATEQIINARARVTNTSGRTGVTFDKLRCLWVAQITIDYKNIHLGRFNNKEDAIEARTKAELRYRHK